MTNECTGQINIFELTNKSKCVSCEYWQLTGCGDNDFACNIELQLHKSCVQNGMYKQKTNWNKKPIVPKYHYSLNGVWCECTMCKVSPDNLTFEKRGAFEYVTVYRERCPHCGNPILWDWEQIDQKASKSKDWLEYSRWKKTGT